MYFQFLMKLAWANSWTAQNVRLRISDCWTSTTAGDLGSQRLGCKTQQGTLLLSYGDKGKGRQSARAV